MQGIINSTTKVYETRCLVRPLGRNEDRGTWLSPTCRQAASALYCRSQKDCQKQFPYFSIIDAGGKTQHPDTKR